MPIETEERGPQPQAPDDREENPALSALRDFWPVPTDTYICGDLPLLLTKLSNLPPVPER